MTGTEHLTFELEGATAIVTMNRPEAKNALSLPMLVGMADAWVEIDSNDDDPMRHPDGRRWNVLLWNGPEVDVRSRGGAVPAPPEGRPGSSLEGTAAALLAQRSR